MNIPFSMAMKNDEKETNAIGKIAYNLWVLFNLICQ